MNLGTSSLVFFLIFICWTVGNAQFNNCTDGNIDWIANGRCDPVNNNNPCGYDGGDCCHCDCVDGADFICGDDGYSCIDPTSECINPSAAYPNCSQYWTVSDGTCDSESNSEECAYDGGDCCQCDYTNSSEYTSYFSSYTSSSCLDPTSSCVHPLAAEFPGCGGVLDYIDDGYCDRANNNQECDYDGGDCCECDCVDGYYYSCGYAGFFCLDPMSDCVDPLVAEYPNCNSGDLEDIENGNCDDYNNNEECGYDGGDCCECDCVANSAYACDRFSCVDPASDCVDSVAVMYPTCSGIVSDIGDGYCDLDNNNEECGYDGGDCCECDCVTSSEYSCGSFSCLDPTSECVHPLATEFPNCGGHLYFVGDLYCDIENNVEECGYDGGDCCECDCEDDPDYSSCGGSGFFCVDPASECVDQSDYSSCRGTLEYVDDEFCDDENNNEDCAYDGGDCCLCTCVGSLCPTSDDDCLDPKGSGSEVYECEERQSQVPPCLASLQRKWFVHTTAHAHDLAEAAYCGNGTFEVEWRGGVTVNRTISVVDGTVMSITGVGMDATIDGGNTTRLFTVISAELHVTDVTFRNGHATSGGSVVASDAKLNFYGTTFIDNTASRRGGAIFVSNASTIVFGGNTTIARNTAQSSGGALYVSDRSTVSFGGKTEVVSNIAEYDGGALCVWGSSSSSWVGETTFSGNTALLGGGALAVRDGGSAKWSGITTFLGNNSTYGIGGAVLLNNGSSSWEGKTSFHGNHAESGGALYTESNSVVSWNAETAFLENSAQFDGGAIYVGYDCTLSWKALTVFAENSAVTAGALFISGGSTVEWSGDTNFTSNVASLDGGAVTLNSDNLYNGQSRIFMNGTSNFLNNTSGTNGGGLALLGSSLAWFGAMNVTFTGNTASVGGGAVYILSTGESPTFTGTTFAFNSAPVGGAVYTPGSSTVSQEFGEAVEVPTNFSGCTFVGNVAETTGGAIDSAFGEINFISTSFRSNIAGVGGALRLAGTGSIVNCEFIENSSGVGGGPAVSKIGDQLNPTNSSFLGNIYTCGSGMIVDVSEDGDLYDTVCVGCGSCQNCVVEDQKAIPQGCMSLLDAGIAHATSDGGIIEKLNVSEGYWRATNTSRDILECFNRNACLGGIALRVSDYCKKGFKGPYCSLCEDGYTSGVGFSCIKCTPGNKTSSIALVATLAMIVVVACVAIVLHLLSGEMTGSGRGCIDRMARRIPLQCVKIIIVAWQILTQVESVTKATYPGIYQPFLDLVAIVTFNFTKPLMIGCFVKTNFHDQLLLATIGPVITMGLLALTYAIALRKHRGSEEAVQVVQQKHMSMALLIAFLVYSTVSSTIFQTFACEALDTDDPLQDKQDYLIADYSIKCDREHKKYQIYAGFMVMLYPVGIPSAYAVLLFRSRHVLEDKSRREKDLSVRAMTSLWEPYKPWRFYYEIIEYGRRVMLTSVLLLIKGDTAAQIAVTIVLAFFFAVTFEILSPYESRLDSWVSRLGHAVIFSSMYLALLIKVDVSDEAEDSQKAFGAVLVAVHVCMMLVVVIESIFVSFALKADKHHEDPHPRVRSSRSLSRFSNGLAEEDKDFGKNNHP